MGTTQLKQKIITMINEYSYSDGNNTIKSNESEITKEMGEVLSYSVAKLAVSR